MGMRLGERKGKRCGQGPLRRVGGEGSRSRCGGLIHSMKPSEGRDEAASAGPLGVVEETSAGLAAEVEEASAGPAAEVEAATGGPPAEVEGASAGPAAEVQAESRLALQLVREGFRVRHR